MSKSKIIVGDEFRTNSLSKVDTSTRAEVEYSDNTSSRIYTNIHYPAAFSRKIFAQNNLVESIKFTDMSDGREWTETRG